MYHNHAWGTVCDNDFDINEGNVVCRELGYPGAAEVLSASVFGAGIGEIILADVHCNGTEESLLDCPHGEFYEHNCDHSRDASVICEKKGNIIFT